jgi:hypothetical protein
VRRLLRLTLQYQVCFCAQQKCLATSPSDFISFPASRRNAGLCRRSEEGAGRYQSSAFRGMSARPRAVDGPTGSRRRKYKACGAAVQRMYVYMPLAFALARDASSGQMQWGNAGRLETGCDNNNADASSIYRDSCIIRMDTYGCRRLRQTELFLSRPK